MIWSIRAFRVRVAQAGWEKITGTPSWLHSATGLKGFGRVRAQGRRHGSALGRELGWYAAFLRWVGGDGAGIMSKVIALGEVTVGVALILGLFTGIAAFFAGTLTMSFGLAGVAGVNPAFFLFEVLFILGWKVVGRIGLDRFVLPLVGTPWNPGRVFDQKEEK